MDGSGTELARERQQHSVMLNWADADPEPVEAWVLDQATSCGLNVAEARRLARNAARVVRVALCRTRIGNSKRPLLLSWIADQGQASIDIVSEGVGARFSSRRPSSCMAIRPRIERHAAPEGTLHLRLCAGM
ncbi:MAG: hypothetical protein AAGE18_05470 [Pseudomonadota bacterium]